MRSLLNEIREAFIEASFHSTLVINLIPVINLITSGFMHFARARMYICVSRVTKISVFYMLKV